MATFTYNSNTIVTGTNNADLLLANDTAGNNNDIVYGLQGDDTIRAVASLNNSTLYGGQGDDLVYGGNNHNIVYGNQGDDFLEIYAGVNGVYGGSNSTLFGGQGDDTIDLDGPGEGNVAYGGAGNSTIEAEGQVGDTLYGGSGPIHNYIFLGNSALNLIYGATGDDTLATASIELDNTTANTVYGGQGGDSIVSSSSTGNTFYGGGGNDFIIDGPANAETGSSTIDVLYGNQGNDGIFLSGDDTMSGFISSATAYGGQGNDTLHQIYGAHGILYGNKGNDLLEDSLGAGLNNGSGAEGNSVLYGGPGDDTLVAIAAGGDTVFGGQGDNLFVGNDILTSAITLLHQPLTATDLVTVGDFVSGKDRISMSNSVSGAGNLVKEDDALANNANDALSFADSYYTIAYDNGAESTPQYLFVYGGSGAGYLFYNGGIFLAGLNLVEFPSPAPLDGMILIGDNAESSVSANDIVASPFAKGPVS